MKTVQYQSFQEEYRQLKDGRKEVTLKQLNLFMDEGVIHCQGRINRASVPVTAKKPILLPPKHWFTILIIREHHKLVHHNGVGETLNSLRATYWIVRGREAVKKEVRRCMVCLRWEGKPYSTPIIPDLPEERVSQEPPFTNTGIDFAGPLYVQNLHSTDKWKVYVCLFTCASTRAIHLELITNLSGSSFLQAFRRFSSRRGLPNVLMSDNAKTFKATSAEVKKVVRPQEVQQYVINKGIAWNFIVEKAPWWGGYWERMVRSVKRCLQKTIGRSTITAEELNNIHNRPLTYLYDDTDGISQALTPTDLIYGRRLASTPSGGHFEIMSTAKTLTKRVRHQFRLINEFTKQWRREYLLGLREHHRYRQKRGSPQALRAGDIVILRDDCTTHCWWRLARIIELLKGKDDIPCAAKVQTLSPENKPSMLRRPIQHLIPLEAGSTVPE